MATKTIRRRPTLKLVLPKRIERAQAEAEKVVTRGVRATLDLLPPATRKAVRELGAQLGDTASALRARGRQAVRLVEQRGTALAARTERSVARLEKRRAQALKAAERESARVLGALQARAASALEGVVAAFDVASAREVAQLGKRLTALERKLGGRPARRRAA